MNKQWVTGRIYARKILLTYFYEQYFLENAGKKTLLLKDIEKIKNTIYEPWVDDIDLKNTMNVEFYENTDEEVAYIVKHYFKNIAYKDIDRSYISQVWPLFRQYEPKVREQVNKHVVSFSYDDKFWFHHAA